jgi:hypothetical protein
MIEVEQILARLSELQKEWALASCLKPQGSGAFDYGVVCGRVKGLALAQEEITKMLVIDASKEAERERS